MKKILSAILLVVESVVGVANINAQQPQTGTAPLSSTNTKYNNGVGTGYWPTKGTGLVLNIAAGTSFCSGTTIFTAGATTITLADNSTNYVYLDTGCTLGSNTTGFTAGMIPIATVTTASGAITTNGIQDDRTLMVSTPGGGGGVQYNPNTTAYIFNGSSVLGDDLGVLAPIINVSTWVANGTTVTVNTTTPHNLTTSSYVRVDVMGGWFATPSPFSPYYTTGYTIFKVASVPTSTQFTFAYSLNTGSGSGGDIQDASYYGGLLPSYKAFLNGHGSPQLIDDSTSTLNGTVTNFSTLFAGVTGTPVYFIEQGGQDDIGGSCASAATVEGYLQTLWADVHAKGWVMVQSTITPAHWSGCGTPYTILAQVNQWIWGQAQSPTNSASGQYWDNLIDAAGVINAVSDSNILASNGGFGPGGTQIWANLVNDAFANQGSAHRSFFGYEFGAGDATGGVLVLPTRNSTSASGMTWLDTSANIVFQIQTGSASGSFTNVYRLAASGPFGHNVYNSTCTNNCPILGMFSTALAATGNAYRQFGQNNGSGNNVVEFYTLGAGGNNLYTSTHDGCASCGYAYDVNGDFWLYGQKAAGGPQMAVLDTAGKITPEANGTANQVWGMNSGATAQGWQTPTAGTTTNLLTMNNSGSGASSGSTFNGSTAQTISYNSIGAAPLNSPNLTGIPTAPTPTFGANNTDIATMAAVQAAIAAAGTGAGIVTYSGPSLTFSGTLYFPIGGGGLSSATETNVDIDSPAAVTIQNMTVQMSAAPGVGNSITYTWRKNAASTALTCTISGSSATSCSDTSHSFTTASLDLLDIQAVTTGTVVGTPTVVMAAQVGISTSSSGTTISLPTSGAQTAMTFDGNVPQKCPDTSGSGTAQSCSTGNAFTPAAGSCWIYTTTTTNSGTGLTVNVNSSGAKSVAVAGPSGWTTTLVASTSIPANKPMTMCDDGTNMNVSGTGYAPASGSSGSYTNITSLITWANATVSGGAATTSSAVATVGLSSIPSTYRHLRIYINGQTDNSGAQTLLVQMNGDTATNYNYTINASAQNGVNAGAVGVLSSVSTSPGTFPGSNTIEILDYAQTNFVKTTIGSALWLGTSGAVTQYITFSTWKNTAAITSLLFLMPSACSCNIDTHTSFTVYGEN